MRKLLFTSILFLTVMVACQKERLTSPLPVTGELKDSALLTVNEVKAWMAEKSIDNTKDIADTSRKFNLGNVSSMFSYAYRK